MHLGCEQLLDLVDVCAHPQLPGSFHPDQLLVTRHHLDVDALLMAPGGGAGGEEGGGMLEGGCVYPLWGTQLSVVGNAN